MKNSMLENYGLLTISQPYQTTKLSDRRRKRPVGCNSREQIT